MSQVKQLFGHIVSRYLA